MKKKLFILLPFWIILICSGQTVNEYKTPDDKNPVVFIGNRIIYQVNSIEPGSKAFFTD